MPELPACAFRCGWLRFRTVVLRGVASGAVAARLLRACMESESTRQYGGYLIRFDGAAALLPGDAVLAPEVPNLALGGLQPFESTLRHVTHVETHRSAFESTLNNNAATLIGIWCLRNRQTWLLHDAGFGGDPSW